MSNSFLWVESNPSPDEIHVDGVVLLNDLETHGDLEGARVIVFNDSGAADKARKEFEDTKNIDVVFQAALDGEAEELSISRLVKFYLANGM